MNILIAEDDDISRDLLRRILELETDCVLTLTEDGEKAWALLSDPAQHFDVGIFDLMMPRLSGLGLVERIRGTPELKGLPIILCTAVKDRATVEKASVLAISHYVVKPYTRARILEKLQAVRAQLAERGAVEDAAVVSARLGVDAATLRELITNLLAKTNQWLSLTQKAETATDFRKNAATAHQLMGACMSLGLPGLQQALTKVESVLLDDFAAADRSPPTPTTDELVAKLAPISAEITRIQGRLKAAA